LLHAYGESFAKKLITEQQVVFIRNYPQLAEWVVRGRYPIAIGPTPVQVERFFEQGLGRDLEMLNSPETTVITAEAGNISLIEGAPHSNAATVFINWFLAKNAQQAWNDATANNSRRTDVTPGDKASFPNPERLRDYMLDNEEFRVGLVEKARRLAKAWIGSR
jgi:iron(III) transport system substrate-binding protein